MLAENTVQQWPDSAFPGDHHPGSVAAANLPENSPSSRLLSCYIVVTILEETQEANFYCTIVVALHTVQGGSFTTMLVALTVMQDPACTHQPA